MKKKPRWLAAANAIKWQCAALHSRLFEASFGPCCLPEAVLALAASRRAGVACASVPLYRVVPDARLADWLRSVLHINQDVVDL